MKLVNSSVGGYLYIEIGRKYIIVGLGIAIYYKLLDLAFTISFTVKLLSCIAKTQSPKLFLLEKFILLTIKICETG